MPTQWLGAAERGEARRPLERRGDERFPPPPPAPGRRVARPFPASLSDAARSRAEQAAAAQAANEADLAAPAPPAPAAVEPEPELESEIQAQAAHMADAVEAPVASPLAAGAPPAAVPLPLESDDQVELTAEELGEATGLSLAEIADLERFGLIASTRAPGGRYFDESSLLVAQLAARFAQFGVEPRHLRMWRTAAEREAGFFDQVVTPLLKQRNPQARRQAAENLRELAALGDRLHAVLVHSHLKGRDR